VTVFNPNTTYVLQIHNGGLTDGEFEKVSSSVISLNGVQIVGPNEFNQKVTLIEKPITLAAVNDLSIELRGKPGGGITVQIVGVDNDAPIVTSAVTPAPNVAGWHKSDVTVHFTCGDNTSGVTICPASMTLSTDGGNQLVSGTATDRAGNNASASVYINLDKTAPVLTIVSPFDGSSVTNSPVKITGTVSDSLSGLATVLCNGSPASVSNFIFGCDVFLNMGPNVITVEATDAAGNTTTSSIVVTRVQGFRVTILSPTPSAVINDFTVLVVGELIAPPGTEVGVTVNGFVGLVANSQFTALVPLDSTVASLTARATDAAGFAVTDSIAVTVNSPTSGPALTFRPFPAITSISQPVTFTLTSVNAIAQIHLDSNGDGTIDFSGATLEGMAATFSNPGIYLPTVSVIDTSGAAESATAIIQVLDINQLDAVLQAKWATMKDALRNGNTAAAANYIVSHKRAAYQTVFNSLTIPLANIDEVLTNISFLGLKGLSVEYEMLRPEPADGVLSYHVLFALDTDGVWRISFF
jgi:hypothetical protein